MGGRIADAAVGGLTKTAAGSRSPTLMFWTTYEAGPLRPFFIVEPSVPADTNLVGVVLVDLR